MMITFRIKLLVVVFCAVLHNTHVFAARIKIALGNDDAHPSATAGHLRRQSDYCSQVSLVSREMLNSPPYNEIPAG